MHGEVSEAARSLAAAAPHRLKSQNAARAHRTRDPDSTCARFLDPADIRTHAAPATNGSNCASGRDGHGEAGEAARWFAKKRPRLRPLAASSTCCLFGSGTL